MHMTPRVLQRLEHRDRSMAPAWRSASDSHGMTCMLHFATPNATPAETLLRSAHQLRGIESDPSGSFDKNSLQGVGGKDLVPTDTSPQPYLPFHSPIIKGLNLLMQEHPEPEGPQTLSDKLQLLNPNCRHIETLDLRC